MALFDEDNPGKNLANATIWLESSNGDGEVGAGGSGGSGSGRLSIVLTVLGLAVVIGAVRACAGL